MDASAGHPLGGSTRAEQHRVPLSALLADLASDRSRERIALNDLIRVFGRRSLGALCFVFAVPNAVPLGIPGLPIVLAAPLLYLTWQQMTGRTKATLPARLRARSMNRQSFARMVMRLMPLVRRLEHLVRPRLTWATVGWGERVVGLIGVVLSAMIFLPLPFSNNLPGLGLSLMSLGVLGRDGLMVALGALFGLAGVAVVAGALFGAGKAAQAVLETTGGI